MDDTDFAVAVFATSTAGFVLAATFLNFLQSAIQIIGIGTAISLGLTIYKVHLDRKETIRRKKLEGIQRLQPVVYNPLLKWAVATIKDLSSIPDFEIWNRLPPPPDLSEEGDYIAIVGDKLKNSHLFVTQYHTALHNLSTKVSHEHSDRLIQLVTMHGFPADLTDTYLTIDNNGHRLGNLRHEMNFSSLRQRITNSKTISLDNRPLHKTLTPCPDDFLQALQFPDTLPSFQLYKSARADLHKYLGDFTVQLRDVIINGERDWQF